MAFRLNCPACSRTSVLFIFRVEKVIEKTKADTSFTYLCQHCWKGVRAKIGGLEMVETPDEKLKRLALEQIGKDYKFGAQYELGTPLDKIKRWDCSELVRHLMWNAYDKKVPDGSRFQYLATVPITREQLRVSDVGFLKYKNGNVHHIAICIDKNFMVEARGIQYGVIKTKIKDFQDRGSIWRRWK